MGSTQSNAAILTVFRIPVLRTSVAPSGFHFEWDSQVDITYRLLSSPDGLAWTDVGAGPFSGTGGVLSYLHAWPAGQVPATIFYRLKMIPDGD